LKHALVRPALQLDPHLFLSELASNTQLAPSGISMALKQRRAVTPTGRPCVSAMQPCCRLCRMLHLSALQEALLQAKAGTVVVAPSCRCAHGVVGVLGSFPHCPLSSAIEIRDGTSTALQNPCRLAAASNFVVPLGCSPLELHASIDSILSPF
jgi:hypothetical protein